MRYVVDKVDCRYTFNIPVIPCFSTSVWEGGRKLPATGPEARES